MRHGLTHRKLNRTSAHRKALLRNMTSSLLLHESIVTTLPKAKTLRPFLERLITKAKPPVSSGMLNSLYSNFLDKKAFNKLLEVGARVSKRNGGYLRILKNGFRKGDKAPMALIELVDKQKITVTSESKEIKEKIAK